MKNICIKILVFFALLLAIYISGCRKGDNPVYTSAIVINTGAVAADGCGWVTKIEDTDYSAINLGENLRKMDLR